MVLGASRIAGVSAGNLRCADVSFMAAVLCMCPCRLGSGTAERATGARTVSIGNQRGSDHDWGKRRWH